MLLPCLYFLVLCCVSGPGSRHSVLEEAPEAGSWFLRPGSADFYLFAVAWAILDGLLFVIFVRAWKCSRERSSKAEDDGEFPFR